MGRGMVVGLSRNSWSGTPSVSINHDTLKPETSLEILAGERPFDLHRFRVVFPEKWQAFLKAHFRSTAEIACFFEVDDRTAKNWVEGCTKPTAPSALIAVARIPGALAELTGVAA